VREREAEHDIWRFGEMLDGGDPPPHQTGQSTGHVKERIIDNPKDLTTVYHWSIVHGAFEFSGLRVI
jgi:hypothetical protein